MLIESSKDILYLVVAFCVLWISIFICWLLYHIISVFRNVNNVTDEVKKKILLIETFITGTRDRFETGVASLRFIADACKYLVKTFVSAKINKYKEDEPDLDFSQDEEGEKVKTKKNNNRKK